MNVGTYKTLVLKQSKCSEIMIDYLWQKSTNYFQKVSLQEMVTSTYETGLCLFPYSLFCYNRVYKSKCKDKRIGIKGDGIRTRDSSLRV